MAILRRQNLSISVVSRFLSFYSNSKFFAGWIFHMQARVDSHELAEKFFLNVLWFSTLSTPCWAHRPTSATNKDGLWDLNSVPRKNGSYLILIPTFTPYPNTKVFHSPPDLLFLWQLIMTFFEIFCFCSFRCRKCNPKKTVSHFFLQLESRWVRSKQLVEEIKPEIFDQSRFRGRKTVSIKIFGSQKKLMQWTITQLYCTLATYKFESIDENITNIAYHNKQPENRYQVVFYRENWIRKSRRNSKRMAKNGSFDSSEFHWSKQYFFVLHPNLQV